MQSMILLAVAALVSGCAGLPGPAGRGHRECLEIVGVVVFRDDRHFWFEAYAVPQRGANAYRVRWLMDDGPAVGQTVRVCARVEEFAEPFVDVEWVVLEDGRKLRPDWPAGPSPSDFGP